MKNRIQDTKQHEAAKVAGFMFLFSLIVPLFNWSFVLARFRVTGDDVETANRIMNNEFLFRIGISVELIMTVGLIVLALALYTILKPVNKNLALLALLLKLAEAITGAVIVLITFMALQMLTVEGNPKIDPEHLKIPVGFILNAHTTIYSIPMVFLGLDLILFSYLFLKSRYIPGIIAGFGIFSYTLIFIHAFISILAPKYATMLIIEIILYTPSCLFEIIIGIWLLAKGIKVPSSENLTNK